MKEVYIGRGPANARSTTKGSEDPLKKLREQIDGFYKLRPIKRTFGPDERLVTSFMKDCVNK